jgi:hypothetical protein
VAISKPGTDNRQHPGIGRGGTAMKTNHRITIFDINQAAFLASQGCEPELVLQGGRVNFSFPADDDYFRLSDAYNLNLEIPILDYVKALRMLRSKMMSAKDNAKDNGIQNEKSYNR